MRAQRLDDFLAHRAQRTGGLVLHRRHAQEQKAERPAHRTDQFTLLGGEDGVGHRLAGRAGQLRAALPFQRGDGKARRLRRLRQRLAALYLRGDRLRGRFGRQHQLLDAARLAGCIGGLVLVVIGADVSIAGRGRLRKARGVDHGVADAALLGDGEARAVLLVEVGQLRVGRILVVQESDGGNGRDVALPRFQQQRGVGQDQIFRRARAQADRREQLALQDFAANIVAQRLLA